MKHKNKHIMRLFLFTEIVVFLYIRFCFCFKDNTYTMSILHIDHDYLCLGGSLDTLSKVRAHILEGIVNIVGLELKKVLQLDIRDDLATIVLVLKVCRGCSW